MSNIVVWSGGADSTLVLCNWASGWGAREEVIALTVKHHSLCNKEQFRCQVKTQNKFKKFALTKGWNIKYKSISITGDSKTPQIQSFLWLTQLMPYFNDGDSVGWGYNAIDHGFWDVIELFKNVLKAADTYRGITTAHEFPVRYKLKVDIIRELKQYGVPLDCIWTCDDPNKGHPCGVCHKCVELLQACRDVKKKVYHRKQPIKNFEKILMKNY